MRRKLFYILVDNSGSIDMDIALEEINKLIAYMREDPYLFETVYLRIESNTQEICPLCDLYQIQGARFSIAIDKDRDVNMGIHSLIEKFESEFKKTTMKQKGDWMPTMLIYSNNVPNINDISPRAMKYFAERIFIFNTEGEEKSSPNDGFLRFRIDKNKYYFNRIGDIRIGTDVEKHIDGISYPSGEDFYYSDKISNI